MECLKLRDGRNKADTTRVSKNISEITAVMNPKAVRLTGCGSSRLKKQRKLANSGSVYVSTHKLVQIIMPAERSRKKTKCKRMSDPRDKCDPNHKG